MAWWVNHLDHAEVLDLAHVGFPSFLHGLAHLGFAFSVLGTTKSEPPSAAKSQGPSGMEKHINWEGKIDETSIKSWTFSQIFSNFHGRFKYQPTIFQFSKEHCSHTSATRLLLAKHFDNTDFDRWSLPSLSMIFHPFPRDLGLPPGIIHFDRWDFPLEINHPVMGLPHW